MSRKNIEDNEKKQRDYRPGDDLIDHLRQELDEGTPDETDAVAELAWTRKLLGHILRDSEIDNEEFEEEFEKMKEGICDAIGKMLETDEYGINKGEN